jgi:hypothetical protein
MNKPSAYCSRKQKKEDENEMEKEIIKRRSNRRMK